MDPEKKQNVIKCQNENENLSSNNLKEILKVLEKTLPALTNSLQSISDNIFQLKNSSRKDCRI